MAALSLCLNAVAQQQFRTDLLNHRHGLSQNFVSGLALDREGFLWAGTKNGLNRYDGRTFKVWTNDPENPNSLANDWVWSIEPYEDFLLIGTDGGGLDFFDRRHERFFHFRRPQQMGGVVEKIQLSTDRKHIWLLAKGGPAGANFFRLVLPDGFWEQLSAGSASALLKIEVQQLAAGVFQNFMLQNESKTVWGLSGQEFVQFNYDTGTEIGRVPAPGDFTGWHQFPFVDMAGALVCHREGYIFCLEGERWLALPTSFSSLARQVGFDWQNRLLIYEEGNLFAFDLSKIRYKSGPISSTDADWQCPAVGQPTVGISDRSNIFWWGTNAGGIQKLNYKQQFFWQFFVGKSIYSTPFEDTDGSKGYFEFGKGFLFSSPRPSGAVARFASGIHEKQRYGRILKTSRGTYWLLFFHHEKCELVSIGPAGNVQAFPFETAGKQPGNFFMDEQGLIWVGANACLLGFDPERPGPFKKFGFQAVLPAEHEVFSLAKTPGGIIWIGTSHGLVKSAPQPGGGFDFTLLRNEPGNPNSLRNNAVAALLADPADPSALWIGTKGGGLTRLDTRNGKMRHLSARNGLPNNVIYAILPDNSGNFWLSSNKGIIRYSPTTGAIRNFTEADGAQGDEFNTWAAAKTSQGRLLFGGLNGLNEINPDDFYENLHLPSVFMTGLKINNHPVTPGDSTGLLSQNLEFFPDIVLSFSQNSLMLSFAALEFTAPSSNRFRYFLEGAESEWAHETTDNSATYLNLGPGSYTFKIMAANGDGRWNPKVASLKIRISPPWWRTWWAYLFYFGTAAAGAWWFYRSQLRRRLEQAENQRLKELDVFKSRLYTNITHEFRTPLTVILGTAQQLAASNWPAGQDSPENYRAENGLDLIRRNGENLLRLVNQMLDLSKLESGAMSLHPQRGNAVLFVKYLVESFRPLAEAKQLQLHFRCETEDCQMDFDAEKLQQVISNLLSNAIKFTREGGEVGVQLSLDGPQPQQAVPPAHSNPSVVIRVKDTGIGIPPEQLPHIFHRFYQVDDTHTRQGEGTGIGLALVKELVKLMEGEVKVNSRPGAGTEFSVRLPIKLESNLKLTLDGLDLPGQHGRQRHPEKNETGHQSPTGPRQAETERPLLLIIDDNPDVASYIASCLEHEYRIAFASDGQDGIVQALERIPDAIVSDVMMPEKDGFEVVQTLKNDERTSHVPIILLTAKADVASKIEGLERGADEYLAKPFAKKELQLRLRNLLALRQRLLERYADREILSDRVEPPADAAEFQIEDAFLLKIRAEVGRHLQDADFGVPELSRAMGMSQSQLYRKIKALTDRSSAAFMRLVRLKKGRELLKTTRLTVSEIAYETGFSTPGYFSDAYLEEFGERPTADRENLSGAR